MRRGGEVNLQSKTSCLLQPRLWPHNRQTAKREPDLALQSVKSLALLLLQFALLFFLQHRHLLSQTLQRAVHLISVTQVDIRESMTHIHHTYPQAQIHVLHSSKIQLFHFFVFIEIHQTILWHQSIHFLFSCPSYIMISHLYMSYAK